VSSTLSLPVVVAGSADFSFYRAARGQLLLLSTSLSTMSAMSTPLQPRRSARERAPAQPLGDEMEYRRLQAADSALMRRLAREPLQYDMASDGEQEEVMPEHDPSSDDEEEGKENVPPASAWVPGTHSITPTPCTAHATVVLPRNRTRTELGYFRCFITDKLIKIIVFSTIAYAKSLRGDEEFKTDAPEMWRYIAARIRMGIVRLPETRLYWQAEFKESYITQLFIRNRFDELQRYWHIAPPTPAGATHTVIDKISPLHRDCQTYFQAYYTPGRDFAIDESMVRCKGRTAWKNTIKTKPTPTGYKLYTVGSDGYLLGFAIYRGKGGYDTPHAAIHQTVVDLVRPWSNCRRVLYFDNLYTSLTLCDHLLQMGILSCGICRPNRKHLPPLIRAAMKELDKGGFKSWQRGQLGCLAWHSARPILILSTHHQVDQFITVSHTDNRPDEAKPQVAVDYNNNKGHVDAVAQVRQYYGLERRVQRTWPSLAWWLIDICLVNAYTLWSLDTSTHNGHLHFRQQVLHQIAALFPSSRTHVQPDVPREQRLNPLGHFPKHTHKQRRCVVCTKGRAGGRRSEVVCELCDVHLCVDPCFKLYHEGQEQGS
jgi:hypothetical protein